MRLLNRVFFGCLLLSPVLGQAQSVTFHADVAPIIFNHCTECHREGEIAPMPLTTFAEVYAYGEFIEYVTATDYMPPWTPDDSYSHFVGERVLTSAEKQILSDWVAQGNYEGVIELFDKFNHHAGQLAVSASFYRHGTYPQRSQPTKSQTPRVDQVSSRGKENMDGNAQGEEFTEKEIIEAFRAFDLDKNNYGLERKNTLWYSQYMFR